MRTIVYIDGYNLYYGRITGTQYKWLDLPTLFGKIIKIQEPQSVLETVKYFTAPALAKFSRRGQVSTKAQTDYHRALEVSYPPPLTDLGNCVFVTILGKHDLGHDYAPLVIGKDDPKKEKRILIWKIVEKKTDVNLAMAMYRDAASGMVDQLVLCSNDSDAEPVLEAIRQDFPRLRIGLITPRSQSSQGERVVSRSLSKWAHWTRSHILDYELANAQLPTNVVAKTGKAFKKPAHWNEEPTSTTPRMIRFFIWKKKFLIAIGLWFISKRAANTP